MPADVAADDESLRAALSALIDTNAYDLVRTRAEGEETTHISFKPKMATKGARDEAPEIQKRDWLVSLTYTHVDEGDGHEAGDIYNWVGLILNATSDEALDIARKAAGITVNEDMGGDIETVIYDDGETEHLMSPSEEEPQEMAEDLFPLDLALRRGYLQILTGSGIEIDPNNPDIKNAFKLISSAGYPEVAIYTASDGYLQVEYDEGYYGGLYSQQGDYALVPYQLITSRVSPEAAFEAHTGVERVHIINYNLDEVYDEDGNYINEGLERATTIFNQALESSTLYDILTNTALHCREESERSKNAPEAWALAELAIRQAQQALATLHAPTPALLRRSGDLLEAAARPRVAEILIEHSVLDILNIFDRKCSYFAQCEATTAAVWVEARDCVRKAAQVVTNIKPVIRLNR